MPEDSGNGRRNWLTKDTFVPWGAAVACAFLAWWAASKYGELTSAVEKGQMSMSEKLAEQRRETSLEMQALRFSIEMQSDRIGRIEKSVETLTRGATK